MKFEQQYEDQLKAIETAIINVYRSTPELLDSQVERALAASITAVNAAIKGNPAPKNSLTGLDITLFEAIEATSKNLIDDESGFSASEFVQSLKFIRKSVKRWNKQLGRQGYLSFVERYI